MLEKDMAIRSLQEEGFHLRMANQPGHQKEEDLKQDFVRALLEAQLHLQLVEVRCFISRFTLIHLERRPATCGPNLES